MLPLIIQSESVRRHVILSAPLINLRASISQSSVRAKKERAWQSGYYTDASCRADRYKIYKRNYRAFRVWAILAGAANDDDCGCTYLHWKHNYLSKTFPIFPLLLTLGC